MIENFYIEMPYGTLHGIKDTTGNKFPIVFIHGMLGQAEDWNNDFKEFKDHPCYAISLRGRGSSKFPQNLEEFSVEDHILDIQALIEKFNLRDFVLVGFSQGVLYAVAYALKNKEKIRGLILQEKTVSQKKFSEAWVERASSRDDYKNKIDVLKGLSQSSKELDFLPQCEVFADTSTLIIKAGLESMISVEALEKMKEVFKKSKSVIFEKSGHDVSSPDYDLYLKTMKDFLNTV